MKIKNPEGSWKSPEGDKNTFFNDKYEVRVLRGQSVFGTTLRVDIKAKKKKPITRYEVRQIKDSLIGPEAEGFEVYGASERGPTKPSTVTLWILADQNVPVGSSTLQKGEVAQASACLMRALALWEKERYLSVTGTKEYATILATQCRESARSLHEEVRSRIFEVRDEGEKLDALEQACANYLDQTEEGNEENETNGSRS